MIFEQETAIYSTLNGLIQLYTNPIASTKTPNANTTPTAIPTMAPVGRLSDALLSAETVDVGIADNSLCGLVIDGKGMAVVDGKEVVIDCSVIICTIVTTMIQSI